MCVGTETEMRHVAGDPDGDVQKCSECGAVIADHRKHGLAVGPNVKFFRKGAKVRIVIPTMNGELITFPLIFESR